jgi:uncharacterized protein
MRSAGRPVTPQPLTDAEFESVSEVLERFGDKRSMSLEALDGLLAAVACGPEDIPQSEYLREIWGDEIVNEDTFLAQPLLREFVTLVMRHRDFIAHTLKSGDVFTPILLDDENGTFPANDWAKGFLRGLDLRKREWAPLLDDEEHVGMLVPIFALAHEHDPDPQMRPYSEPVSAEMREKLIVGAAAGVMKIYRYFTMERPVATNWSGDSTTYRRIEPKVGRNEPCPCGSGQKFKKCCGIITFH